MNCESHPGVEGMLTVDLPSIGIRRYMCQDCRLNFKAKMGAGTQYKGKREAWERDSQYDYNVTPDGVTYGGNMAYPHQFEDRYK